jgi:P27 family predicted phage terminase small subunit
MGVRGSGRKRKPTATKRAQGTFRKDRANLAEPKPEIGEPEMPYALPDGARKHWRRLAPQLLKERVLTTMDGDSLAALCIATWQLQDAIAEIKEHGQILGYDGRPIQNPGVKILFECLRRVQSLAAEFGMTPASRGRVSAVLEPEGDALAAILAAKGNDEVVC